MNATIEGEDVNEEVIDSFVTAKEEGINSKDGQEIRKWKLTNNSYSYTNDKEMVNYSLELEEMDEIILDKLILDSFEFIPYQYKEDINYGECLSANARVLVSDIQFKKIKEMTERESITVIRQGINETPRQMSMRIDGWSTDGKVLKCQFTVSDYEERIKLPGIFGALGRLVPLVIKQAQMIEQLSDILIQKNVIKDEEYESIKARTREKNLDNVLELYKVNDLDEFDF